MLVTSATGLLLILSGFPPEVWAVACPLVALLTCVIILGLYVRNRENERSAVQIELYESELVAKQTSSAIEGLQWTFEVKLTIAPSPNGPPLTFRSRDCEIFAVPAIDQVSLHLHRGFTTLQFVVNGSGPLDIIEIDQAQELYCGGRVDAQSWKPLPSRVFAAVALTDLRSRNRFAFIVELIQTQKDVDRWVGHGSMQG